MNGLHVLKATVGEVRAIVRLGEVRKGFKEYLNSMKTGASVFYVF